MGAIQCHGENGALDNDAFFLEGGRQPLDNKEPESTESKPVVALVRKASETVALNGFSGDSMMTEFGVFDIKLYDEHDMLENLRRYFNLCTNVDGIMVTISCYGVWSLNKKVNSFAKVIPAIPISHPAHVRVIFFDDNLEFEGKPDSPGICNLRDIVDGTYVEFGEGKNKFLRSCEGMHSIVHHSADYKVVLVRANILDAMEDQSYFTRIIDKYSIPSEKVLIYMDVNSTIVSNDTISDKDVSEILLSSMFEVMILRPREVFTFSWDGRDGGEVKDGMSLKQVVKNICKKDKAYYQSFYKLETCEKIVNEIVKHAVIEWSHKRIEFDHFKFRDVYERLAEKLLDSGTTEHGIANSWFECYDHVKARGGAIVINSYGVDTRKIIAKTVKDEAEVIIATVNMDMWNAGDVKAFEEQYGEQCQRITTGEINIEMRRLMDRGRDNFYGPSRRCGPCSFGCQKAAGRCWNA